MKGVKVQRRRSLRKEMKAGVRRERPARGVSASSLPRTKKPRRRDLFGELMEGVSAMRAHRERRITLRADRICRRRR